MNWTPDDEATLGEVYGRLVGRITAFELTRAIANKAAELLAARGGTMTAEQLADFTSLAAADKPWSNGSVRKLLQHVAAQGAEVARYVEAAAHDQQTMDALRAELAQLNSTSHDAEKRAVAYVRESALETAAQVADHRGAREAATQIRKLKREPDHLKLEGQVAEDVELVRSLIREGCEEECPAGDHTDACEMFGYEAALSRLAALAQQGKEATKKLTALREHVAAYDAAPQDESGRDARDAVAAIRQTLGALADESHHQARPVDNAPSRCGAYVKGRPCPLPRGHEGEHERWATPGQIAAQAPRDAERGAKASEAFNEEAAEEVGKMSPAMEAAYDSGAEAMRAACWLEIQATCQRLGLHPNEKAAIKAAIEGASP
jgi:hypothetical protein